MSGAGRPECRRHLRGRPARERGDVLKDLWLALYWTGPIGVGAFLAGLGVLFWGIAQLQRKDKKE